MKNRVAIPSGLINALWCCWKYEDRDGRRTKVPINPRTGYRAKSNDLNTFTDDYQKADDARTVVGYDGVGLGLFNGLCAIDIDHCVSVAEDGTIQLSDVAKDIIERMNSYTELSPSGTGVHILFRAPGLPWDTKRYYVKNPNNGVEIYIAEQTNRFMTFTGAALFSDCDIEERSTAVLEVAERYMMRKNQSEAPASTPQNEAVNRTPLDDDELIRIARSAKNGNVFSALWDGNISGYQSQSEADLALCNLLAFYTGKDPEQMDRLFRRSGLMRDKWDRATGGSTYGAYTIQRAIDDCRTVYTQGRGRATLKPPDLSDSGNAQVFVEMYRGSLIYTDALGWLWWNGQQWERNDHKAMNCAGELSERMLKDAQRANREALAAQADAKATVDETEDAEDKSHFDDTKAEVKKAAAYLKHANNLRSARCLKNMLELAKHDLVVKADALDANPFDLNTPAGIVDLKTGELRPHDPDAYCSQITEASPDNKGAEMWQDFLHTITENDSDVERFLQAAAGMSLIGEVYHEGIIIAYGGGRNGKSTYFNALGRVLGGYSGGIDIQVLTSGRQNKGPALATLRGKRLVVTGELDMRQKLDVETLKKIASTGNITIEEKYRSPEDIKPSHSLVLFTNHLPHVDNTDNGTWRRLMVVPFQAVIPQDTGIQNYADVLAEEAGGAILSWAIEGAVQFVRNGYKLDAPKAVTEATKAYREHEDWLSNFIDERCILEPGARQSAGDLYNEYKIWAGGSGEHTQSLSDFNTAMAAKGFHKITPKGKKTWVGLKLDRQ